MRTIRRIATIAATAAVLAIGPVATAQAASPGIVDPAGDARNSFDVNIDEIDIRSVDVASDGTNLTFTFQVDDFPATQNRTYSYLVGFTLPDGRNLYATADNSNPPSTRLEFRTAQLATPSDGENSPDYSVSGTSSVDRATDRVTLSFPVSAVTAQSTDTGIPVLGTTVTNVQAFTGSATNFRTVATDSAAGGPFVLGG